MNIRQLRRDMRADVMPGGNVATDWGVVSIFARNFVNRASPPLTMEKVDALLAAAATGRTACGERIDALLALLASPGLAARAPEVHRAVLEFTRPDPHFAPEGSCLAWIRNRVRHWQGKPCAELDADELLRDIRQICDHPGKAFKGMALAVTANLFADLGAAAFAKPDRHVVPIISLLCLVEADEEIVFRAIIELTKREAPRLAAMPRFAWLGAIYPRHMDRLIYLLGSDNHGLAGHRNTSGAVMRRRMMIASLRKAGIISSQYADLLP